MISLVCSISSFSICMKIHTYTTSTVYFTKRKLYWRDWHFRYLLFTIFGRHRVSNKLEYFSKYIKKQGVSPLGLCHALVPELRLVSFIWGNVCKCTISEIFQVKIKSLKVQKFYLAKLSFFFEFQLWLEIFLKLGIVQSTEKSIRLKLVCSFGFKILSNATWGIS